MAVRSFAIGVLGAFMLAADAQAAGAPAGGASYQSELPPPSSADLVSATTPYRIGPLDKLTVTVFGAPDLSGTFQTDAAGKLLLPLIGEVEASGKTPSELAADVAQRLRGNYVRNPQVTVNLEEGSSQTFTVDGQVTQPGSYPIAGNMSLMRAIATAKGTSEYARLQDVIVFRTVDGQPMAAVYNLEAIRRGRYADPRIYPNDMIVVGDLKERRRFQHFMQSSPFLTPIILVLERLG